MSENETREPKTFALVRRSPSHRAAYADGLRSAATVIEKREPGIADVLRGQADALEVSPPREPQEFDLGLALSEAQSRIRTLEAELAQNRQDFRALWSELRRIVRVFETTPAPSPVEPPGSAGKGPRRVRTGWWCRSCEAFVRSDEDGCCGLCGSDTNIRPIAEEKPNVERHNQKAEATESAGTGPQVVGDSATVAASPGDGATAPQGSGVTLHIPKTTWHCATCGGEIETVAGPPGPLTFLPCAKCPAFVASPGLASEPVASPPRDDDGPRRMYEHADALDPDPDAKWDQLPEPSRAYWRGAYHFAHAEGRQAERVERGEKVADLLSLVSLRVLPESWRMRSPQAESAYKELVAKLRELLP